MSGEYFNVSGNIFSDKNMLKGRLLSTARRLAAQIAKTAVNETQDARSWIMYGHLQKWSVSFTAVSMELAYHTLNEMEWLLDIKAYLDWVSEEFVAAYWVIYTNNV